MIKKIFGVLLITSLVCSPVFAERITLQDGNGNEVGTEGNPLVVSGGGSSGFGIVIDGGGSTVATGAYGCQEIPSDMTITKWTLTADQSGSAVVDVWLDTYANFPPTVADSIAGSEKPTLSSAIKNQDLSLSTWDTAVTAGDFVCFNVDSATTVQRLELTIS